MGKLSTINNTVDLNGLNKSFYETLKLGVSKLPFDTVAYSAFRSIEKQQAMHKQYLIDLKKYTDGKTKIKPTVVNKPGNSSHNYGLGIDIHPTSLLDKDYNTMYDTFHSLGLVRDKIERWHFQDSRVSFEKMKQWYEEYKKPVAYSGMIMIALLLVLLFYIIRNRKG